MAEFITKEPPTSPMAQMGKPIPLEAKQRAYEHAKAMGVQDCFGCVNQIALLLERDKPYEAMAAGMKHVDLTGTYRLFAALLS